MTAADRYRATKEKAGEPSDGRTVRRLRLGVPAAHGPTGGIALVSGEREVEEAIRLILATAPGERPMRPEFGCAHPRLRLRPGQRGDRRAGSGYEVRSAPGPLGAAHRGATTSTVDRDAADQGMLYIDIRYSIRGTNDPRNLVFPFYVIPAHDEPDGSGTPGGTGGDCDGPARPEPRRPPLPGPRRRRQALVQQRCPEWTDHNVSDPGVTLIETFA